MLYFQYIPQMSPQMLKEQQKARARAFEQDLKKKCQTLKAIIIGCHWLGSQDEADPNVASLQQYKVGFPVLNSHRHQVVQSNPKRLIIFRLCSLLTWPTFPTMHRKKFIVINMNYELPTIYQNL